MTNTKRAIAAVAILMGAVLSAPAQAYAADGDVVNSATDNVTDVLKDALQNSVKSLEI
jgi:hypothetical protein